MFKNYFKVALRNLVNNKVFASLNIIGLAIGMATAILIGLWITDETGFNHYYPNHKKLAQAMVRQVLKDEDDTGTTIAMPLGAALQSQQGDLFKRVSLVSFPYDHVLTLGEKKLTANGFYAQQAFPLMFGLEIVKGSKNSLLDPATIMISRSMALSLFGNTDAVNKNLLLDNKIPVKVGAVYADLPENTNFAGTKLLMSWANEENNHRRNNTDWDDHNGLLFVELNDAVSAEQASEKIKNLPTPNITAWKETAVLQPLDKTYLYSEFKKGKAVGGRIQFVFLFAIIGVFVLFLACINFMNLSTARSSKRAKEVGIRKTIGSLPIHLVGQFLIESILLTLLAFVIALMLVQISLPFFNYIAGKHMVVPWQNPGFWLFCLGFAFFTGFISGSYPAFYLSRFEPIKVLKGAFQGSRYNSIPRQVLVVLQFTVSLSLIIGTIIIYRQIMYARDRPSGYTRAGLITLPINTDDLNKHYAAFREEVLTSGAASSMSKSSQPTTNFNNNNSM
ncbi:MAG TPA: ABC transporter permease, partial [Puia sp.]